MRTLVLRKEPLAELSTGELAAVAAAGYTGVQCVLTDACVSIRCTGLMCVFTDVVCFEQ